MQEVWKPVKGYEGYYEVSNLGRVKSLERYVLLKSGNTRLVREKIMRHGVTARRYHQVGLSKYRREKRVYVHRLVAEAFILNKSLKPYINHIDHNPENNYVTNLEWCTQLENIHHAIAYGRKKGFSGEKNFNSKLKEKEVSLIRELYRKNTYSVKFLSDMFNISLSHTYRIIRCTSWM